MSIPGKENLTQGGSIGIYCMLHAPDFLIRKLLK